MLNPIVTFIVVAIICAIFLWALAQFPTLDASIIRLVRIVILVVLSLMLLNLLLGLLFGRGLSAYLGG